MPTTKCKRKTLALLADYMTHSLGAYEGQFRNALAAKCRELDVNLLLVYGGAVGHPSPGSAAQNEIFKLIRPDSVDGVLLLTTTLSSYCGVDRMDELVAHLHGIPTCSVGVALEGIPSIVIDNYTSMTGLVEHLIVSHGRRKFAFIGGTPDNPEAQARYEAYAAALQRHGLDVDPDLVTHGYFWSRRARSALEEMLDKNLEFDALVCANDSMAHAALALLNERGLRVPRDVVVTGFDDVLGSKLMKPPLTTAAQPFEAIAERSLKLVLDQLEGHPVPLLTQLQADLIVRQSCGCGRQLPQSKSRDSLAQESEALRYIREHDVQILARLRVDTGLVPGCEHTPVEGILDALARELQGQTGAFVEFIEAISDLLNRNPECYSSLQHSIASLRSQLRPYSCTSLEDLWHEARDSIELALTRSQFAYRIQLDDAYLRLLECSEEVSRALNRDSFRTSLARILPLMHIHRGAISQFANDNREQLELLVGLRDNALVEDVATRFPAHQLAPPGHNPDDEQHTSLVLPLVLESRNLGVAMFEYSGDAIGQLMARTQITSALGSVLLHQAVLEKSMQHERSVQERTATTKRMEALSLLAGGVAHDLNNALGPLVALPDIILDELESATQGTDMSALRGDIESVKSSALRAAQTIKDLLTLGRQGRTTKELVDVRRVIDSCASSDLLRRLRGTSPNVQVRVSLPPGPLLIQASESHIARAISNLVHNATEAISGKGEVVIRARPLQLDSPVQGFETIDTGHYVVITVTDTGNGIAEQDLHRIFEPFFSRKHVNEYTGSGLGLAIVHGVVKEHEGSIDVTSKLGIGTEFSLYLPRAEAKVCSEVRHAVPSKGSGRILIVDDEPIQLRTGRRVLARLGYEVDTLESGALAHERFLRAAECGRSPYELIILDMLLNEDLDGLERFEQIRRLFPRQRAIVVSGHAPPERADAALQSGLAWLAKPYTTDAMVRAVEAALAERPSATIRVSCKPAPG